MNTGLIILLVSLIVLIASVTVPGSSNSKPTTTPPQPKPGDGPQTRAISGDSLLGQVLKKQMEEEREEQAVKAARRRRMKHFKRWPSGSVDPSDNGEPYYAGDIFHFDIAGINFRGPLLGYLGEQECRLEAEPENEHDPQAIRVVCAADGHVLGYVPRDLTDAVHSRFTLPCQAWGHIELKHGAKDGGSYYYGQAYMVMNYD